MFPPHPRPDHHAKIGGANTTVGEFGTWEPIGAEAIGGGYEVVWKTTDQDLWNTDSNGNYIANVFAPVAGESSMI